MTKPGFRFRMRIGLLRARRAMLVNDTKVLAPRALSATGYRMFTPSGTALNVKVATTRRSGMLSASTMTRIRIILSNLRTRRSSAMPVTRVISTETNWERPACHVTERMIDTKDSWAAVVSNVTEKAIGAGQRRLTTK